MPIPKTLELAVERLKELRSIAEPKELDPLNGNAFSDECKAARSETWSILRVWLPDLIRRAFPEEH